MSDSKPIQPPKVETAREFAYKILALPEEQLKKPLRFYASPFQANNPDDLGAVSMMLVDEGPLIRVYLLG